jgi:hypothetical protein
VNEGVNFTPRGQISPLGAKFTPRGEIHPWGPGVKLRMALREPKWWPRTPRLGTGVRPTTTVRLSHFQKFDSSSRREHFSKKIKYNKFNEV